MFRVATLGSVAAVGVFPGLAHAEDVHEGAARLPSAVEQELEKLGASSAAATTAASQQAALVDGLKPSPKATTAPSPTPTGAAASYLARLFPSMGHVQVTDAASGAVKTLAPSWSDDFPGSCPGSAAWFQWASCQASFDSASKVSCKQVASEIRARLAGEADGSWVDMHNKGHYSYDGADDGPVDGAGTFKLQRRTGDGKYTDKIHIALKDNAADGSCHLDGCSVSQVFSVLDFGTNYCNVKVSIVTAV